MTSELNVWLMGLKRAVVLFGFTLFSTWIAGVNFIAILQASFVTGGLYFFTELMRFYAIKGQNPENKITYSPLIFA